MYFLSLSDVLSLHSMVIGQSGGATGVRDQGALEAAIAQPKMTFAGQDLYPGLFEKGAALCYSLVMNHPFVDGNKRIGHAALEVFLVMNGCELTADVDDSEAVILSLADGKLPREELLTWVTRNSQPSNVFG